MKIRASRVSPLLLPKGRSLNEPGLMRLWRKNPIVQVEQREANKLLVALQVGNAFRASAGNDFQL